jgi:hypothetical protein
MPTNNAWNSQDPVQVAKGGTGIATATAYAPICAGTTATGVFQAASTGLASAGYVLTSNGNASVPSFQAIPAAVQYVQTSTGARQDCSTVIPDDDTIPQKAEGDEVLTLAITPRSATNQLVIKFNTYGTLSSSVAWCALFQDAIDGALAATGLHTSAAETGFNGSLSYKMAAGTTSATTFKIRVGPATALQHVYLNGNSAGRKLGGVANTTLEIWEIVV